MRTILCPRMRTQAVAIDSTRRRRMATGDLFGARNFSRPRGGSDTIVRALVSRSSARGFFVVAPSESHARSVLETALRQRFGFEQFRPGQLEAAAAVFEGRDLVAVMPTGSGKSLCFQLPAILLNGTTVVVSPLIALMKDQVDVLR